MTDDATYTPEELGYGLEQAEIAAEHLKARYDEGSEEYERIDDIEDRIHRVRERVERGATPPDELDEETARDLVNAVNNLYHRTAQEARRGAHDMEKKDEIWDVFRYSIQEKGSERAERDRDDVEERMAETIRETHDLEDDRERVAVAMYAAHQLADERSLYLRDKVETWRDGQHERGGEYTTEEIAHGLKQAEDAADTLRRAYEGDDIYDPEKAEHWGDQVREAREELERTGEMDRETREDLVAALGRLQHYTRVEERKGKEAVTAEDEPAYTAIEETLEREDAAEKLDTAAYAARQLVGDSLFERLRNAEEDREDEHVREA